jgi:methylmalonyl-CoA mutase cobalamin-binding subunit
MKPLLDRAELLPEPELPESRALIDEGRRLAAMHGVGPCPFLETYGVGSEAEYKRARAAEGAIMLHAHLGYRDAARTRRAYAEIHERLAAAGHRLDRYGLCFDQNMGYPKGRRAEMPRGTGLILDQPEDFAALTACAPVAPHFGDFMIGTPASVENTAAALAAGSTVIGNLGQYFAYRMSNWDDEVGTTAETVKAIAMVAAQPVEVMVQSNVNDGYAALFRDLACVLGWVLIERYIVEELLGARVSFCYGHNFSEPLTRLAFQRAVAAASLTPGSMIYGNTSIYDEGGIANYGGLASYFLVDVVAQRTRPSGHAINPVPASEAERIPDIDEIVDAHLFANRMIEQAAPYEELFDLEAAEALARRMTEGGEVFRDRVLAAFAEAGIDTGDPVELLLSLRRLGARRLEALFGPGERPAGQARAPRPLVKASTIADLEDAGQASLEAIDEGARAAIAGARLTACVATTDVHEYGKILIETVLGALEVGLVDAGVCADPERVAARAKEDGADFIALSTYNGIALDYITTLSREMERLGVDVPVFIGGRLNQVPAGSNTSLPVDVSAEIAKAGAVACPGVEEMLSRLIDMAHERVG